MSGYAMLHLDGFAIKIGNQLRRIENLMGVVFLAVELDIITHTQKLSTVFFWHGALYFDVELLFSA